MDFANRHVFDHCVLQYYGNYLRNRYGFPNWHWETLLQSVRGGQWFVRVLRFDMITLEFVQTMGNSIRAKRAIFACSRGSLTWLSIRRLTCWSATCVQMLRRF